MKKLTSFVLLIPFLSSCIFYVPLRERERQDRWEHLETVDTTFDISSSVSFHNQVRALWALDPNEDHAVLRRIEKHEATELEQQGWIIVHHDLYAFPHRGKISVRNLKSHWTLLVRRYYGKTEIKVR